MFKFKRIIIPSNIIVRKCENRYKIVNVKILPEIIQDMVSINKFFAVQIKYFVMFTNETIFLITINTKSAFKDF